MAKYFVTTGLPTNFYLKDDDVMRVYRPETNEWEISFFWLDKIYVSDFYDYKEVDEAYFKKMGIPV